MSLYIDLSEFLTNPITTGIQRIAGEICKYLPRDAAVPVGVHGGRYVAFSPKLIEAIGRHFGNASESSAAEIRKLGAVEKGTPVAFSPEDTILVPEVFTETQRLKFFRELPEGELHRCRFLIYDLLPLTHPEYFPEDTVAHLYGYFKLIRQASHSGFISEDTRASYYGRLKRTNDRGGVVLPLGCDSLGPRPTRPTLNRPPAFSVLGTVEPRKNHELILDAFEPLLRQIDGLRLSFIGKLGWVDTPFAERVRALSADTNSGFRFHSASGDVAIRNYLEQSRASIYVSAAEGYGLPPVESLWAGTPVIASTAIPSLQGRESLGVHFVEPLNVVNLRRAVLAFLDDDYANQKTEEALALNLPTWRSFTGEVLRWCGQDASMF
jgi:glycosyltransferase involved in cell wall biosynthesis